ncbi:MAG: efflux RND transporter periplasmic adaptor subunit [Nitrospira sp.]|nr:efflux RND transporter periplasmic adaptor subunit [Nitrospira sp.]
MSFAVLLLWSAEPISIKAASVASHADRHARCLTKPSGEVLISAPVDGVIESMRVNLGDIVKQGDVVATLEATRETATVVYARTKAEMVAAIQAAQFRTEFTKRKVARAKDLAKMSAIGQHELDEAETEHRLAEAAVAEAMENQQLAREELRRAEAELALRTIHSPLSGLIVERFLSPGEMVRQGPLLKAVQLHPLQVDALVPLSWVGKLFPGMAAEVRLDMGVSHSYTARIDLVGTLADGATNTFAVRLTVPNSEYRIPAGLPCTVRFSTP